MISRPNGEPRISLTWSQAVWGLTTIAAITACWYNLSAKVDRMIFLIDQHERRITAIENRNRYQGFTQEDADEMKAELRREFQRRRNGQ